ncbi:MAG: diaminopimelate decarboxylase [bacterium]|jgi:diaminopimelate decarboxylase
MIEPFTTNSRFFHYRKGELLAENVHIMDIVSDYGTPTYIYSSAAILDTFNGYKKGLSGIPHIIAYAVKANGNLSIIKLLADHGAGADLTSAGELYLAQKSGIPADKMVLSGVGKTDAEIEMALDAGILMFNVESEAELENIARIANNLNRTAPISLRVNPDIDAKTHPKISTGLREHKFGVPWEDALELYQKAAAMDCFEIRGISAHIGSSLQDVTPLLQALDRILGLRNTLKEKGIKIEYVDIGGGLGIRYQDEEPALPEDYAARLKEKVKDSGITLIVEPGRSIVGNAGILVSQVQYVKRTEDRTFVVIDAGMNDLARPAIYGAYHRIVPVQLNSDEREVVDVVGPICESSDVFGRHRDLPPLANGNLLAICSAGAYGFSMASHYNGRVKPAEVLVKDDKYYLVRKREELEELIKNQVIY